MDTKEPHLVVYQERAVKAKITYRRVIVNTLLEFWGKTTIVGLGNAGQAHHLLPRVFWLAIFILGMYRTVMDVTSVFEKFSRNPFTTQIDVEHLSRIQFPSVTFCNQNQVNCLKLVERLLNRSEGNSDEFNTLMKLYYLSDCGEYSTGCETTWHMYYRHYQNFPGVSIPADLWEGDDCLDCKRLLNTYHELCSFVGNSGHQDLDKGYSELQELDFLWKDGNCYNQTMADPTPQVTDIPETLDTCSQGHGFGPFMSQSPGSLDYDDPSNGNDSVSPSNHSTNTYIDDGNITSPGSLPFSRTGLYSTLPGKDVEEYNEMPSYYDSVNLSTVPSEYDLSEETTSTPYTHTDNFTFLDIVSPTKTSNGTGFSPSPMMQNSTFVKLVRRKRQFMSGPDRFMGSDYGEPETGFCEYDCDREDMMDVAGEYDEMMTFLAVYMNLSQELKQDLGYSFNEMLKDCVFMGGDCTNNSFFAETHDPSYGNCFTYNSKGEFATSLTGTSYSLSVTLDIMHATYLPKLLTEKAGARVAIHRPGTRPVLDDHGIDIPPGMVSSIAIKRRVTNFLAAPYSANCTVFWNTTNYAPVGNSSGNKEYTITECQMFCLQRNFINNCSCTHPFYPNKFSYRNISYENMVGRYCNLTSKHPDSVCVSHVTKIYAANPLSADCDCNVACLDIDYTKVISMASWPPKPSVGYVHTIYHVGAPGDPDDTVRENLLRLDVYFNTLTSENITQVEVYKSFWDLVSELGGALSLYIGISIFLLVEVIELFFYLIFNSYLYCVGRYELTEETSECHCHCQEAKVHPLNATKQPFSSDTSGPTPAYNTLFKSDNIQQRKFTANSMDVAFDKAFNP